MLRLAIVFSALLVAVPTAGAAERLVLFQNREGYPSTWTAAPNGSGVRTLGELDSDPYSEYHGWLQPAPNGRDWVAMGFFGTSASAEVVVNDVAVRRIVEDGPNVFADAYSPDGAKLAIALGSRIRLVSLPGGTVTDLGVVPGVDVPNVDGRGFHAGPVWSPDGSQLAFAAATAIVIVPADGSPRTSIPWAGDIEGGDIQGISWKPTGDAVLIGADNLYRVDVPSGVRTLLATGVATGPVYSPDGSKIAWRRNGALTATTADLTNLKTLSAAVVGPNVPGSGAFAWSPNSQRLAYTEVDGSVRTANANGTDTRVIAPKTSHFIGVRTWLANAIAPAKDKSAPSSIPNNFLTGKHFIGGAFRDGLRSTPVVSARVSMVRRANGRCQGLTTKGFRTMTCAKAATSFVSAAIVFGPNGPTWRVNRHLPKGRYTIRVRGRDAAGNVNLHPKAMSLTV